MTDAARERAEQIHKEWLAHSDWETVGSWGSQAGEILKEMIAAALRERDAALRKAVKDLYYAAHWTPDRNVNAAALWEAVRDAVGLEPGHAPALREQAEGKKP